VAREAANAPKPRLFDELADLLGDIAWERYLKKVQEAPETSESNDKEQRTDARPSKR
jgi:hypothetical protein